MTQNTVQTFFGSKPNGATKPVGAPISAIQAIQILDKLAVAQTQSECLSNLHAYFTYDVSKNGADMEFEIICDMAKSTMSCKAFQPSIYIRNNKIYSVRPSDKIKECIKRASMGKCQDTFMRDNVWSVIFADQYTKQK